MLATGLIFFSNMTSSREEKKTYADAVKSSASPLRNTWWRRLQEEDEKEAIFIAMKRSVEELKVVSQFFSLLTKCHYQNICHYLDLGNASDWLKIWSNQEKKHYQDKFRYFFSRSAGKSFRRETSNRIIECRLHCSTILGGNCVTKSSQIRKLQNAR